MIKRLSVLEEEGWTLGLHIRLHKTGERVVAGRLWGMVWRGAERRVPSPDSREIECESRGVEGGFVCVRATQGR